MITASVTTQTQVGSFTGDHEPTPKPEDMVVLASGMLACLADLPGVGGVQGPPGEPGAKGDPGPKGDTGAQGPPGTDPYMQVMSANGALTGPLVKCTGAMAAVTLLNHNAFRIQVIYNAGSNGITVTPFPGTTLLDGGTIQPGEVGKFATLQGGTQVQRIP